MAGNDYNFAMIEKKWQERWKEQQLFKADDNDTSREKFYCLTMYPYPSGVLHMGHVINYTLGDVIVRYKLLRGYNVLSPMGWDSFGLPAENAARKQAKAALERGEEPIHPDRFTEDNIAHMTSQMERAGWGYDWSRELATSRPNYYRWTQWLFLLFYQNGLAEKKVAPVNWCDSCETVLANEQVLGDGTCERCGTVVVQHDLNQWFFKMSSYAQKLLDGHAELHGHWPEKVIKMQEEWIGRSEGAKVDFTVTETGESLPIFTTRPDTLWGVTFMSLAPEHPLIEKLVKGTEQEEKVLAAVRKMRAQSTSSRLTAEVEKEGVWTGFHVTNPVNGEQVPLWVANFALMTYGTGAVMSVPAHDQRDFEFARKYNLPVRVVIQRDDATLVVEEMTEAYEDPGAMTGSGPFSGRLNTEAMGDIIKWLKAEKHGEGTINYKLRDWLLSRQRYWGAPIPIIYCEKCGEVPVPMEQLPVELPMDVEFKEGGGNPLASCEKFVNTSCPQCGSAATRETDTMDTFVDSSWYFLRYCSPEFMEAPFDPKLVHKWMPVDLYIGGIEHATMHLIYCRFFTQVLHDLGYLEFTEPAKKLFCQGMVCKTAYYCENCKWLPEAKVTGGSKSEDTIIGGICAKCGGKVRSEMTKISKSKLNIVDPDAMMDRYGADCVRLYMLSDAPPDQQQVWSDARMQGSWRFLNRLWDVVTGAVEIIQGEQQEIPDNLDTESKALRQKTHASILKITDAIEGGFRFNTAISSVMELLNKVRSAKAVHTGVMREAVESMLILMAPIAPHFAEELWETLGHTTSIFQAAWPRADKSVAMGDEIEIPVQVNGKIKARLIVAPNLSKEELEKLALEEEAVQAAIQGCEIKKVIAVPGRIVNIAVK
ncbi:MAG: leucine--tRNA ligase [Planctomycetes bacterium]|nr:leucine--tRNA ligase [Planctomycetota bacterium]